MQTNYATYATQPEIYNKYDSTNYMVNFNVTEEITKGQDDEDITQYKAEYILVPSIDKETLTNALIRRQYSLSEELAILRQRDSKADEFTEYNTFAEECKKTADEILSKPNS